MPLRVPELQDVVFAVAAMAASFIVAGLVLSPGTERLAVVLAAAVAVVGFGFRAPRVLLVLLVLWLTALGLVRRVVDLGAGSTTTDPLLLVAPLALGVLLLVAVRRDAFGRMTPLSTSVLVLSAIALLEVLNPRQGGLRVGLGGLLLVLVPMLAFWIGRSLVDDRALRAVLILFGGLAVPAAGYGLWQTFGGFPSWDARWVASSNFTALNVYGTVRPFSFFSSFAEYGFYLAVGIAVWLAFGRAPRRLPLTFGAVVLLGVALVYESARLVVLLLVVALGIGFAAHRGVRPVFALVAGAGAILAASLVAGQFAGTGAVSRGGPSSLIAHETRGLASPFGSSSTGSGHLSLIIGGLRSSLTNPAGDGVGAVTLAASRLGGVNAGTEADPSNAAVGLGLPGLLAYLSVALTGLLALYRVAARRRDALAAAALMVVLATALEWLNGGQYAIAFLPWLVLGWADRANRDQLPASREAVREWA